MKRTEYYLCHFDDGSGCWVWIWQGHSKPSLCFTDAGEKQTNKPGDVGGPSAKMIKAGIEMRISRRLARCLIRSWKR